MARNHARDFLIVRRAPGVWLVSLEVISSGLLSWQRRLPSIAKARASFHFEPRRSLHQVLADVIGDERARLGRGGAVAASNP